MKYITYSRIRSMGTCLSVACCFFLFIQNMDAQSIKVMSYNIHHGRNVHGTIDIQRIGAIIKKAKADLVGLQEVDSVCARSGQIDQMKELARLTGMHYTFRKHFDYDGGSYGLGILSRYPIVKTYDKRIPSYPEGSGKTLALLVTDVKINKGATVRFATVHFDYREDSRVRSQQASETMAHLKNEEYPVILTGDLNAGSDTLEIQKLSTFFKQTDTLGDFTFPAQDPKRRIDYILISRDHLKKVRKHKVLDEPEASDHRPVWANLSLQKGF